MCTSLTEDDIDELLPSLAETVITASCTSKISGCVQLLPDIDAASEKKTKNYSKFHALVLFVHVIFNMYNIYGSVIVFS